MYSMQVVWHEEKDLDKAVWVNQGSFIKGQTSGTSSNNEWQRVTANDNEWYNEWQQMTMSDNEWYNEWQRVIQWVTTRDNKWQWVRVSGSYGTTNENGTVHFKEWTIAILSITKTHILLLQEMNGCN